MFEQFRHVLIYLIKGISWKQHLREQLWPPSHQSMCLVRSNYHSRTIRVSVIPAYYTGATLSYSDCGHSDATVPFIEVRTEMIYGQLESYSSSIWLAYPIFSHNQRETLLTSRTCVLNTEIWRQKTERHREYRDRN